MIVREKLKTYFIKYCLKAYKRKLSPSYIRWRRNGFSSPSPQFVKTQVLKRNGINSGTWVETGTYLGDTTKFLTQNFPNSKIISLEPQKTIYDFAKFRLRRNKNVSLVKGSSEEKFEEVISRLAGAVNFWLDGHYSGDITYQGESISPIEKELSLIEIYKSGMDQVVVFIDDIRDFDEDLNSGYPSRNVLVDWANRNDFKWNIEQDIFIAKSGKK
jgi:hypothetical protein